WFANDACRNDLPGAIRSRSSFHGPPQIFRRSTANGQALPTWRTDLARPRPPPIFCERQALPFRPWRQPANLAVSPRPEPAAKAAPNRFRRPDLERPPKWPPLARSQAATAAEVHE